MKDIWGWPKSTYYHHQDWWKQASASTQIRYLDAGRTDDGLWSRFMREVPAPKSKSKAVRQKVARQKGKMQAVTVSESEGDGDL